MTTAGLILAGGRGRRMGGVEKLFLPCRGGGFLSRLLEALAPLKTIYLSVDGEEPYQRTGLPLVVDRYPDAGPMGGICTALEQCPEDALFVTACDMPHLDRETVERLFQAASRSGTLTLAWTAEGVQPLLGVCPASVLPHLRELLRAGCLRMRALLERVAWTPVPLRADSRAADNINTAAEYQALLRMEE